MNSHAKYYRLNNIYLSIDLPVLIDENGKKSDLEPKVWQLILLFCQHHNKVVSRDEIISQVYNGTIVSDNAVNKLVAKVRKLLGDTPNNARFIRTVPKQGYSLIAEISTTDCVATVNESINVPSKKYFLVAVITLLLLSIYFLNTWNKKADEHFINSKLSALTHSIGVESSPHLSLDRKYLVYQKNSPQHAVHQWWIKGVEQRMPERRLAIENQQSPIAWSRQKNTFLYVERTDKCVVHSMSVEVDNDTIKQVMDCGDNWIAQLLYSGDELGFYYTARKETYEPWRVYFYNFKDKTSTAIIQPQPTGIGNYSIDLSPNMDKLLILSSHKKGSTALYELQLASNELKKKGTRNWPLYKAIWHHDNERIVHSSQRYARELLVTDFSGEAQSTLVSTSKRVSDNFMRHPNGIDFYFTSFQMNNDLVSYIGGVKSSTSFDNSEVYEKLPVYAGSTSRWYFVSNRLGTSQIFFSSRSSAAAKQVSMFEVEHEFTSLNVSENSELLAFHDGKYLTILVAGSGKYTRYEAPKGTILSSNWLGSDKVSISLSLKGRILVYIFDIEDKSFSQVAPHWQAVFSGQDTDSVFAIEAQTNQVFEVDSHFNPIAKLPIKLENVIDHTGLQVQATKGSLVYAKKQGLFTELLKYNVNSKNVRSIGKWLYVAGFDAFDNHLILSFEKDRTGDVMRTHLKITN